MRRRNNPTPSERLALEVFSTFNEIRIGSEELSEHGQLVEYHRRYHYRRLHKLLGGRTLVATQLPGQPQSIFSSVIVDTPQTAIFGQYIRPVIAEDGITPAMEVGYDNFIYSQIYPINPETGEPSVALNILPPAKQE